MLSCHAKAIATRDEHRSMERFETPAFRRVLASALLQEDGLVHSCNFLMWTTAAESLVFGFYFKARPSEHRQRFRTVMIPHIDTKQVKSTIKEAL